MIEAHRKETDDKEAAVTRKQFDEGQKYRLEGWKKANDRSSKTRSGCTTPSRISSANCSTVHR